MPDCRRERQLASARPVVCRSFSDGPDFDNLVGARMEHIGDMDLPRRTQQPRKPIPAAAKPAREQQALAVWISERTLSLYVHAVAPPLGGRPSRVMVAGQ